jgi:hypothetical protein
MRYIWLSALPHGEIAQGEIARKAGRSGDLKRKAV